MSNIEHDRISSAVPREEEKALDRAIRPKRLDDYVGQPSVKQQMRISSPRPGSALKRWITC